MLKRFYLLLLLFSVPVYADTINAINATPSPPGEGGDTPPAGWSESIICVTGATPCTGSNHPVTADSHTYTSSGGVFEVTSEGGRIIGDEDSFPSWMYTTNTTSDYTITTCVQDATQEVEAPDKARTGLMIRDGTAIGDRYHHINIMGLNGLYWNERFTDDVNQIPTVLDATSVTIPEGFRIEVDRANNSMKVYRSDDCTTGWTEQDQEIQTWFASGNTLYFHLTTAPQDIDNVGLFSLGKFDSVVVDTSDVDHGGAGSSTIAINDPAAISEESTPQTFTITRTGSGSGSCSIDWTTNDGTGSSGTDYTAGSGTVSWTDAETGGKNVNVTILDRNAVTQGDLNYTVDISLNTCSDTITDSSGLGRILDADTGGSFTAHTPSYTPNLRGWSCFGCDWTTYLATDPTYQVCYVTNLNTSGTGSLSGCLGLNTASNLLFIVPLVSGVVNYDDLTNPGLQINQPGLVYVGQAAPSPGFHVRAGSLNAKASNILIMHYSGWLNLVDGGAGKTLNFNNSQQAISNVVAINTGALWGVDGMAQMFDGCTDCSFIQGLHAYAVKGDNPECSLYGSTKTSPANDRVAFLRTVCAHFNGRGPKLNGTDNSVVYNSIIVNWANNATDVNTKTKVIDVNVEGSLYVYGSQTGGSLPPVRCTNTPTGTRVYMDGNRASGGSLDDSSQSNLFQNVVGCVFGTSSRFATHPNGYSVETIGAGAAGELAFAALICAHVGPRPADRLTIYSQACSEILNRVDTGTGGGNPPATQPTGAEDPPGSGSIRWTAGDVTTLSSELGGFPTAANNGPCDTEIAGDCNTGNPAMPDITGDGTDGTSQTNMKDTTCGAACAHINAMWTWVNDMHCDVMPAGATGC